MFLFFKRLLISSVWFLLFPSFAFAQGTSTPASNAIVVATVNVANATFTQQDNIVKISFDISNRVGIQPDVKYGVILTQDKKGTSTIVDEQVYGESINLGENASLHKTITYTAPSELSGTYNLWLSAGNSNGFSFGRGVIGKLNLKSKVEYFAYVDPTSCYLTVKDEKDQPHYVTSRGVDIASTESLVAHCTIENKTSNNITLIPEFITKAHGVYGNTINTNQSSESQIVLSSKEKRVVDIDLPKATNPQAYTVSLIFKNTGDLKNTNTVNFNYVLRGASATIQNVTLDKDVYGAGDKAKLSILWLPSIDLFSNLRKASGTKLNNASVSITIKDKNGNSCVSQFTKTLDSVNYFEQIPFTVTNDCVNPQINVKFLDSKYGVLDSRDFTITSSSNLSPKKTTGIFWYWYAIITFIFVGSIVLLHLKYKKKFPFISIIILFVLFSLSTNKVKADTFYLPGPVYANVWVVNKASPFVYAPGETVTVAGNIQNYTGTGGNLVVTGNVNGSGDTCLLSPEWAGWTPCGFYDPDPSRLWTGPNVNFTAPNSPGSYSIAFQAHIGLGSNVATQWLYIPYTVVSDDGNVTISFPSSLTVGQVFSPTITINNTGVTTWSPGAGYKVGIWTPQDDLTYFGINRVYLPSSVGPGQSLTLSGAQTQMRAPNSPGTYSFNWKMVQEGVKWFGTQSNTQTITVTSPPVNGLCANSTWDNVTRDQNNYASWSSPKLQGLCVADTQSVSTFTNLAGPTGNGPTYGYTWSCPGTNGGSTASCSTNATCSNGASGAGNFPTCIKATISASPNPITYNSTAVLTMTSSGATSCNLSGINANEPINTTFTYTTPSLISSTQYAFGCSNSTANLSSGWQYVTVTVCPSGQVVSGGVCSDPLGTYIGYFDGSWFIQTPNITQAAALSNCQLNRNNNPTHAIMCTWNGTQIYSAPALGDYRGYFDGSGSPFISSNIDLAGNHYTLPEALANCQLNYNNNPTHSIMCTWNGNTIFQAPALGTYTMYIEGGGSMTSTVSLADATASCTLNQNSNPNSWIFCKWNGNKFYGSYHLTSSAGGGGSISPLGNRLVDSSATQAFSISPSGGYHTTSVQVDYVEQGAISNYTFPTFSDSGNVMWGHTITASFAANSASSISANPSTINYSQSSLLSYSSSQTSSCSINGVGAVTANIASSVSVTPLSDTTYTITCSGTSASTPVYVASGNISARQGSCLISVNASSCTVYLDWSSVHFSSPNIVNGAGASLYTSANGTNQPVTVKYGGDSFTIKNGSFVHMSTSVSASCTAGSVWDGVACRAPGCGSANGTSYDQPPTTNLCNAYSTPSATGAWSWYCSIGAVNSSMCNATQNIACGLSGGGSFPSAPQVNLCSQYTTPSSNPPGGPTFGPWSWQCLGQGAPVSCSATYFDLVPTVSIVPNTNQVSHQIGQSISFSSTASDSNADMTELHFDVQNPDGSWTYNYTNNANFTFTGNKNMNASFIPTQLGTYRVKFSACDNDHNQNGTCRWTDSTLITVISEQDGACGSSSGGSYTYATDITSQCDKGTTPSYVTLNNPTDGASNGWTWSCGGLNGGNSTSCQATYIHPRKTCWDNTQVWVENNCASLINLIASPTSIQSGDSVTVSWDIQDPIAGCTMIASSPSSSPTADQIAEINAINFGIANMNTDTNDQYGSRKITTALVTPPNGQTHALGKKSFILNHGAIFKLYCTGAPDFRTKTIKINISNLFEG